MEELLLRVEVGYFWVDRDESVGELEVVCQAVAEAVAADDEIVARTALVPAVTVATKQDGRSTDAN